MPVRLALPFAALLLLAIAGCGGSSANAGAGGKDPVKVAPAGVRSKVVGAEQVNTAAFPHPAPGQSLQAFAGRFDTRGPQAIAATSVFRPPSNRLAFGLLDASQHFVYGKTVVYLQRRGDTKVEGPYAAPADDLITQPQFRSQQAASNKSPFAAIYEAQVRTPEPGTWNVLVVSDLGHGRRIAAATAIQVVPRSSDPVPDVGQKAPKVATDTLASVGGKLSLLDTRIPPAPQLAKVSFAKVVGHRPVALLFATPQLCQSRVCGPVTDEMLQLSQAYGKRMTFIHQEVYVDNNPAKGLRPALERFHLRSEPWLFTVRKDGTIAARLEGSIGLHAFEAAVKAALK
jgi:hypothetical protein